MKAQLRLAQGASVAEAGLDNLPVDPLIPPSQNSIQLRVTAEDPEKNWSLSIGKIQSFNFPSGNGVRVDTALVHGSPTSVSADFDSVIAKLIVTAPRWEDVVAKAKRALDDISIVGNKTNIRMLKAIVSHSDFQAGTCDTQWLEAKHDKLLDQSQRKVSQQQDPFHGLVPPQSASSTVSAASAQSTLFRKDDAWSLSLTPAGSKEPLQHHLQLNRVLRNDFPSSLAAEVTFTTPSAQTQAYTLNMRATNASASALNSQHRQGSREDPSHVIVPFSGKLVEVLVDVGDVVRKDDVICVVKQMKMELEVRSHKAGVVSFVTEAEDDEDVAEGLLAAVVEDERMAAKL